MNLRSASAAVLAVAVLAACSSSPDDAEAPPSQAPVSSAPDSGEPAGEASVVEALNFSSTTVQGDKIDAASLAGKPTVFWFWAPWCTICRGEAAGVERIAAQFGDDVNFVGVAALGEVPAMEGFISDTGVGSLTHLADLDLEVWKRFGVTSQPSYAFVSANGDVNTVAGGMGEGDLEQSVSDLIAG